MVAIWELEMESPIIFLFYLILKKVIYFLKNFSAVHAVIVKFHDGLIASTSNPEVNPSQY